MQNNQNSDTKTEKNLDPGNESSNPHTNEISDPMIKTDTTPKRDFSLEPIKQENDKHVPSNDLQNNTNSDNR